MPSNRPSSRRDLALAATALALLLAGAPAARAATVWVAPSTDKLRPSATPGTAQAAALSAARNEFEAFQVAITGPATGVSVTGVGFTGPGQVPAPRFFREAIINLANASAADGATGPFPDAMVPDVDDVVGEKRNAFPFDVPSGETRAIWVEVHVPDDAAPGTYQGVVTIHAAGQADVAIPVTLTVWDFALPSTSSLKSHFAVYYGDLPAAHAVSGDALSTLRARYAQLGLDHRISMGGVDDGNRDLNHFAQFYGALIDGTGPTQLRGAKLTTVQFMGSRSTADYSAWASFFKGKGWFDRLFDYTCDEPPLQCAWSDIPARNAMMKAADPHFRSLVTTDVQEATAQGVLSSIDLLVPVVNYMDDKPGNTFSGVQRPAYDAFLAGGGDRELWMYQSCMSHGCGGYVNMGSPSASDLYFTGWPSYMIDTASVRARAMEWLSFRWGATGELYWEATWAYGYGDPWTDQWQFSGNGDGNLFYPGTPAKIGGQTQIPVASLRLKMLREGMEDYEYLKLLSDAGDPGLAQQIAASLFPNAWTEPSGADLLAARERIARRILELTGKSTAPQPVAAAQPAGSGASGASAAPADGGATSTSTAAAQGSTPGTATPPVLQASTVPGHLAGSGCSAGSASEIVTLLGAAAALLMRRRR